MSEITNTETECRCNKDGWVKKKLGEVCEIKNGKNQKKVLNPEGVYPIYGSGGIMGYADEYICEAGTTIIGRKGTINKPLYVNEPFWNVDTAFGLQPKQECDSRFLFFLCKSIDFTQYDKSVTIPSLVKSDLQKIDVTIPPLPEQQRIVSELDCLNGIIEKQKEQLKQLDELAQSIFYEMFGDPVENEKGWEVLQLGNICQLKAGKSIKASELSTKSSSLLYPCYGGNGIRGFISRYSHSGPYPIIGRQGALCGNVVLAKGLFYATEHAVVVRPKIKDINILWLFKTLLNLNLNRLAQGVAQPGLAVSALNKVDLILPPLPLQQQFASKIEAIEHQKELINKSIAETETLFNSRMDYYFG